MAGSGSEDEPSYGQTYLSRKLKIAFSVPPTNDADVFANDLGFVAIVDVGGELLGYNVSIGGGMGATHGDPETYPRLADVVGFITPVAMRNWKHCRLTGSPSKRCPGSPPRWAAPPMPASR